MFYSQGDLVIVKFPFTDLKGSKPRPAIVVSNSKVNKSSDFIVVMVTTKKVYGEFSVFLSNKDVSKDFKPPHSSMYVYCKKVAVLNNAVINRRISQISNSEKLSEILVKIKSAFDLERA